MGIESGLKGNPEENAPIPRAKVDMGGKIQQLFGQSFEISKIAENDQIPVGGKSIFSTEANIDVTADFENFKQFFADTRELAGKYDLPKLAAWLRSKGMEIDEKLFAELFAFMKNLEEKYPDNAEGEEERVKMYDKKDTNIKLSDLFNTGTAQCAEIAALAQGYLQQENVSSTYFSGDVLWNSNDEFSEKHSFIVIRQGDKAYIYDPTNPTRTTAGKFPSIYTTEANFDEEMAKGQKRFVTAINLLNKKEAFYGTNNGTSVRADEHIV